MTGALLALALAAAPPAPGWCQGALSAIEQAPRSGEGAWATYEEVEAAFPERYEAVVVRARGLAGEDEGLTAAYDVLAAGARAACTPAPAPDAARAAAARVLADPAFTGARESPDFIDELILDAQAWLFELLESEGMQRYAESTRFVFLSLLVLAALFIALRLWRQRAALPRPAPGPATEEAIERERIRSAAALLADAEQLLEQGALRPAVNGAFAALLARLGERGEDAVHPARTNREILSRLPAERAATLGPPFADYEARIYQGRLDEAGARSFLSAVRRALGAVS